MVHPAIADMNNVCARPDDHCERQGRRWAIVILEPERLDEVVVRALDRGREVFGEVFQLIGGVAVVRSDRLAQVFDDRGDGHGARHLAARAPAHAVRHCVQVGAGPGQPVEHVGVIEVGLPDLHGTMECRGHEVIFVHFPDVPRVRDAEALDQAPSVGSGA